MNLPIEGTGATTTMVTTIAPLVIGPLVTWLLKKVAAALKGKIPPEWQPIISAVTGALIGVLGGDASSVITASVSGLAGAKMRDLAVGKPNAVSRDDAAKIADCDFGNV